MRAKPDLTSADGVATSIPAYNPFYGTSAAAPHAAAVAALALSGNPGMDPAAMRAALTTVATDIEAPGWDRDTGVGIPLASKLLDLTGATPQAALAVSLLSVTPGGDGDANLGAGESARVVFRVSATGDDSAKNIAWAVSSPNARILSPASRNLGTIGRSGHRDVSVTIRVANRQRPGDPVLVQPSLNFSGAPAPVTRTFALPVGQAGPVRGFSSSGPPVAVPDNSAAGVDVPISVSGVGTLSSVTFSIDGTDCTQASTVGLAHTYVSDLAASLVAPDGTVVQLFNSTGGNGQNFCQTVFTDAATTPIQGAPASAAPFTGQYRPVEALQVLVGRPGDGTWRLHVTDISPADTGTVQAVSLQVSGYVPG